MRCSLKLVKLGRGDNNPGSIIPASVQSPTSQRIFKIAKGDNASMFGIPLGLARVDSRKADYFSIWWDASCKVSCQPQGFTEMLRLVRHSDG